MARNSWFLATIVATIFLASTAEAVDPAARCESQKVKAIGKYVGCLADLDARAAFRGEEVDPTKTAECADEFFLSWDQAQVSGNGLCSDPPGADASVAQATAALCEAWAAGYVQGGDPDICSGTCDQCEADLAACMTPVCGDGRVDAGEQCDGTNLTGDSCESLGFESGTLACSESCAFDTSGCVQCVAASLTNGSFECGPSPGSPGYQTLSLGATDVCGWVVTDADVDIKTTWWVASDGLKSLDLNGTQPGAIAQTFSTIPGGVYEVSFDMAGNTIELRNSTAIMEVSAAGQSATFTVQVGDYSGPPFTQMDWTPKSWSFVANATTTTIEFKSQNLSSGAGGPALDNVRILECS